MTGYREYRYRAQDGLSLYYRDYGDPYGATLPVLCLPGLTRNSNDFQKVALRLSKMRRVICPDYRGRGRSDFDPRAKSYQPATYLNDIKHLLAITGISRTIVIGTSLGGLLAMGMGAAMPMSLAGVVLNDIGPEVATSGLNNIMGKISTDRPHISWDSAIKDLKCIFPSLILKTEADWLDAARGTWREGDDGNLHFDWDIRLADKLRIGPPIPDLWPIYHTLDKLPTLVIRGAVSDVLCTETFTKMAMNRSNLQQITVPDVGHAPTLSEPIVQDKIDAFLETLSET